ncbi:transketolase [Candidatus Woesebacteria bacterium]|nr:transketolase [Candidatus Woesebacteria bacterium]
MKNTKLKDVANLLRYYILLMTTKAGSGHPTSSLSSVELITALFFGGHFHYDVSDPDFLNNDRFILSKGHASPLFYALWAVAGEISEEELLQYRKFDSVLEGHPTKRFKHTEVATGSLGQGLSVGIGMALNAKYLDKLSYKTYVLLGDSEMVEGSNWEAIQVASHYKLDNLIGMIDVNRLGQSGPTMLGYDIESYEKRVQSFGWDTYIIHDGHNLDEIDKAYSWANENKNEKPKMLIAKTIKGKGISFLEDKEGWHGKVLNETELSNALEELGKVEKKLRVEIAKPEETEEIRVKIEKIKNQKGSEIEETDMEYTKPLATRKAYGHALVEVFPKYPNMVVLDAEVSNSTYSETFKEKYPDNFFEMFIAEQNMVGVAAGLYLRGKIPFVSTFASFFTRAADQIRVSQYSDVGVNFIGSHAGVSIGEDGPTQMGLEDVGMFRSLLNSVVLYPCDSVSCEKLVFEMAKHTGICYLRTTRMDTPVIYDSEEEFPIGGSKILKESKNDQVTIVAAGVTLHESLKAYEILKKEGISVRLIDAYCVKPIDGKTLQKAAKETKAIITVEDHFSEGGLGDAVLERLSDVCIPIYKLAVNKMPRSGTPQKLLSYEEISSGAIVERVKLLMKEYG